MLSIGRGTGSKMHKVGKFNQVSILDITHDLYVVNKKK
jgi:hypothetical protein